MGDRAINAGWRLGWSLTVLLLAMFLVGSSSESVAASRGEEGWILLRQEGQSPARSTFRAHPWWYDKVRKDELIGGAWASHFSDDSPGRVTYRVEVPEAGSFDFWLRANPIQSSMRFRVGDGAWRNVDFSLAIDSINIAEDQKADLRFIAWVPLGQVELKQGPVEITFEANSRNHHHGAIDAFYLSNRPIQPRGRERPVLSIPGESVLDEQNTWPFETVAPSERPADARRMLDLRSLNEERAGQSGFIRLSEDGRSFVRGDGEPIRFWAVGSDLYRSNPEAMKEHVRFLAGLGVNMVRLHTQIPDTREGAAITATRRDQIEGVRRFVAVARDEGIYVTLSPFWAHIPRVPRSWGIEGYEEQAHLWGVMFFNPDLQRAYRAWMRELLEPVNPHTGIPLKDDPALAILQIKNEDSLLFYTSARIAQPQRRLLERQFSEWVIARHGSAANALQAWQGARLDGDRPDDDFFALHDIWHQTQIWRGGKQLRLVDELEFMARTQRQFYEDVVRFLRDEIGARQLINAMNWKSADPVLLDDAERWTYAAAEVMAVNRYTGVVHTGANNGYRIDPGHHFQSRSVLRRPLSLPVALKQPDPHPMLVTESTWVHPTQWQSEGPFLISAYQSLTGVDAFYWFSATEPRWLTDPRRLFWRVGDSYAMHKWSCSVPMIMGQFPAHALAFRRGDVQEGSPVVVEHRSLNDLWTRRVPIISESGSFDPNRDEGSFAAESPIRQEVDRRAFLVGPVRVVHESDASRSQVADVSRWIDEDASVIRGNTGQIKLDYGKGVLVVDSPRYQGVGGFLADAGGSFTTADLSVQSENRYAMIAVVSMDDRPIRESGRILIQVGTESRLTGWLTRQTSFEAGGQNLEGEQIVNSGSPPWQIVRTKATVEIRNSQLRRATALDVDGYAVAEVAVERREAGIQLTLPPDAMYVILER